MLATLADEPPAGEDWLNEIKYDGYRVLARIKDGDAELFTRNGNNRTAKFPAIARAASDLPIDEAWLDGEFVFIKPGGRTSFEGLQAAISAGRDADLTYMLFDMMFFNGKDLRTTPVEERKSLLKTLLESAGAGQKNFKIR